MQIQNIDVSKLMADPGVAALMLAAYHAGRRGGEAGEPLPDSPTSRALDRVSSVLITDFLSEPYPYDTEIVAEIITMLASVADAVRDAAIAEVKKQHRGDANLN